MKRLIIILLLIIIGFLAYDFYKDWNRFRIPNYTYKSKKTINANHPDKKLLLDYHQAIERLNGFVITQWTTNEIDVFAPEDDDEEILEAVAEYNNRLGVVKFYETQLLAPQNELENKSTLDLKRDIIYKMYHKNPTFYTPATGDRNALIYEVQILLNTKGSNISVDGEYNVETQNALRVFEERNGLYSDGILDEITLGILLE